MKQILAAVAALLLLCGCGKGSNEMDQALSFRTALLSAGGCTFSCDVTADVGGAVTVSTKDAVSPFWADATVFTLPRYS